MLVRPKKKKTPYNLDYYFFRSSRKKKRKSSGGKAAYVLRIPEVFKEQCFLVFISIEKVLILFSKLNTLLTHHASNVNILEQPQTMWFLSQLACQYLKINVSSISSSGGIT